MSPYSLSAALVVKSTLELQVVATAIAASNDIKEANPKASIDRVPETRWNFTLRRLKQALPFASSPEQRFELEKGIEFLTPLQVATDALQANFSPNRAGFSSAHL
jgi:hypothetical protein